MAVNEKFSVGYELCKSNAELWFKEALHLYSSKSYGHSYAILVNSMEAWAQAFECYLNMKGEITSAEEIKEVFSKHPIKIKAILAMVLAYVASTKIKYDDKTKNEIDLGIKKTSRMKVEEKIEYVNKMYKETMNGYEKEVTPMVKEIFDRRNQGIYVNYDEKEGKFSSPSDISENDVNDLLYLASILKMYMATISY